MSLFASSSQSILNPYSCMHFLILSPTSPTPSHQRTGQVGANLVRRTNAHLRRQHWELFAREDTRRSAVPRYFGLREHLDRFYSGSQHWIGVLPSVLVPTFRQAFFSIPVYTLCFSSANILSVFVFLPHPLFHQSFCVYFSSVSVCFASYCPWVFVWPRITGERNYHIFYELIAGATAEERKYLHLGAAADYKYLAGGQCTTIDGVSGMSAFSKNIRPLFRLFVLQICRILSSRCPFSNNCFQSPETYSKTFLVDLHLLICILTACTKIDWIWDFSTISILRFVRIFADAEEFEHVRAAFAFLKFDADDVQVRTISYSSDCSSHSWLQSACKILASASFPSSHLVYTASLFYPLLSAASHNVFSIHSFIFPSPPPLLLHPSLCQTPRPCSPCSPPSCTSAMLISSPMHPARNAPSRMPMRLWMWSLSCCGARRRLWVRRCWHASTRYEGVALCIISIRLF